MTIEEEWPGTFKISPVGLVIARELNQIHYEQEFKVTITKSLSFWNKKIYKVEVDNKSADTLYLRNPNNGSNVSLLNKKQRSDLRYDGNTSKYTVAPNSKKDIELEFEYDIFSAYEKESLQFNIISNKGDSFKFDMNI